MTIKKHNHRVQKHKYKNGESIFFCILDDCSFKINIELSIGKRFQCYRCGNSFIMTPASKRMFKPHCISCTKGKSEKVPEVLSSFDSNSNLPKETSSNVTSLKERLHRVIPQENSQSYSTNPPDDESDML